jgi:hypothetical protein
MVKKLDEFNQKFEKAKSENEKSFDDVNLKAETIEQAVAVMDAAALES